MKDMLITTSCIIHAICAIAFLWYKYSADKQVKALKELNKAYKRENMLANIFVLQHVVYMAVKDEKYEHAQMAQLEIDRLMREVMSMGSI